jgi:spermidine/putrescine transport system permease protein
MIGRFVARLMQGGLWVYVPLFTAVLYLPSACVLLFSLNSGIHIKLPLDTLTFDWYRALARNDALIEATLNSLRVAGASAFLSTAIGVPGAFVLIRYKPRGTKSITSLSMMPLLIPTIILAISLLVLLRVIGIDNSLIAITLGHVVLCTPLSVSIMMSRFASMDWRLEEAAMDLGATGSVVFRRIILPLSATAILSSLILCFLTSFDEFLIAFFLSGTDITLPLFIWAQLRFPAHLPEILALSSCVLLSSLVLVIVGELLRRWRQT